MRIKIFKIFIAIFIIAAIVLTFYANIGAHKANAAAQSGWTPITNGGRSSMVVYEWVSPDGISYWVIHETHNGGVAMCPRYNN